MLDRHDLIELILEHAIQRGEYSGIFMIRLQNSTIEELLEILRAYEESAP
jgi:hypothetical protein